jgi:hypothetical protein
MDPQACLDRMIKALDKEDYEEADYAREDLWNWIRRGGFISHAQLETFNAAVDRLNEAQA